MSKKSQSPKPSRVTEADFRKWLDSTIHPEGTLKRATITKTAVKQLLLAEATVSRWLDKACAPGAPYAIFDLPDAAGNKSEFIGRDVAYGDGDGKDEDEDEVYDEPVATETIEHARIADLPGDLPHKDAMPRLNNDDRARLFESVAKHGVREPITTYGPRSYVLDGHHRLEAAIAAGIDTIPIRHVDDLDEAAARRRAIECNLERRHLADFEKYDLAEHIVAEEEGRSRRAAAAGKSAGGRTAERIAKKLGMSKDSVKRAKVVKEQGSPELKEQVKSGQKSLKAAAAEITAAKKETVQARRDRQTALGPDMAPGGRDGAFPLLYLDLRQESWIRDVAKLQPSEIRDSDLEALPCSTADLAAWFATRTHFVAAVRVTAADAPYAGPALDAMFGEIDMERPDSKPANKGAMILDPTSVINGKATIQVADPDEPDYNDVEIAEAPHSYIVVARVRTNGEVGPPFAAPAPVAIRAEQIYRTLTSMCPGPALSIHAAPPTDKEVGAMPADWSFVDSYMLRDYAAPRAVNGDGDGDGALAAGIKAAAGRQQALDQEAAAAPGRAQPPKPKAQPPGAAAAAGKKKRGRRGAGAGAAAAAAEQQREEFGRLAANCYLAAVRTGAAQTEGESHLWLIAHPRPEDKAPDLDQAIARITPTGRKPSRLRAFPLAVIKHAAIPKSAAKHLAAVDLDEPAATERIRHTLPTKLGKKIGDDLDSIRKLAAEAADNPDQWK